MKKIDILGKIIIYMVLFCGIVLSVLTYYYIQKQHRVLWESSQKASFAQKVQDLEKDLYLSTLQAKANILKADLAAEESLISNKYTLDVKLNKEFANVYDLTAEGSDSKIQITNNQIKQILSKADPLKAHFFTLDAQNLYLAFYKQENKKQVSLYIYQIKDLLNQFTSYPSYKIDLFSDSKIIQLHQFTQLNKPFSIAQELKKANLTVKVLVDADSKGVYGIGHHGIVFMVLILITTFLIASYLFKQNTALNRVNKKMINQSHGLKTAYELFKKITSNSFDIISILDKDLKLEYSNSAYAKTLNYNPRNLQGLPFGDLLPELNRTNIIRKIKSFNFDKGALSFECEMLHSNKKDKIIVEAMVNPVLDENNELTNYIFHAKDITAKRESVKALLQSKRRFKDFADSSADWLWETDEKLRFSFISSGIKQSTGFGVEDLVTKKINTLFHQSSLIVDKLTNDKGSIKDLELKIKNNHGEEIWLRISAIPVYNEKGYFTGYRGVGRNITYMKQEQEKLLDLATKDYLTGLLNRSAFMHELNTTLNLAKRNGIEGALLFIDLDMFKVINESHGYDAGDKVLLEISETLKVNLRTTDVVGRIGGDEFAVIMHDINPHEARKKIKDLISKLSRLKITYNSEQIQITCSIGVVKYPNDYSEPSQILTAAGLAMHKAKDMGRNRVYMTDDNFFEDSFAVSAKQKMKWLNILRDSLENEKFEMHFQPMMPVSKKNDVIFESLLRIRDEDGKLGSPIYFIEAAENFGLAQTLDVKVLQRCLKHHKDLIKHGKDCMLSINISGISLGDDLVLNALKDLVKTEKPVTNKIIIEVTETAAMRDEQKAKQFVAELHNLGFKFALDDFGSGYSSFYYLKNLDVDYIKIDGEFIKNLENSPEDRHFVKALTDLAKGLDVQIIAEFVENQYHVNILKEIGVDYMQGYHISKPLGLLDDAVKSFDEKSIDDI